MLISDRGWSVLFLSDIWRWFNESLWKGMTLLQSGFFSHVTDACMINMVKIIKVTD